MDRLGAAAARNHGREAARARLTALALNHTVERLDARVAVEADGIAVPTVNDLCPTVLSL